MSSTPPSTSPVPPPPPPPPPTQGGIIEAEHVVLMKELSRQITELKASFAAAEEERKNLQQQVSLYAAAAASECDSQRINVINPSITASTNTTEVYASVSLAAATSVHKEVAVSVSPTTTTTSFNTPLSIASQHLYVPPPCKTTCAPQKASTDLPGMYHHFNNTSITNTYEPYASAPIPPMQLPATTSPSIPLYQTHYPPIRKCQELPVFSGKPEEWPMFIVAFKETSAAHGYTDLENLSRLQRALKGDAKLKVEALLIHPNSIRAIISTLEFHYGRPEILIRSQLSKIRSFPTINDSKINEIVNFRVLVSNLTVFLENVSASSHLTNPTLLDELVMKLPLNKREEWARHTVSLLPQYPSIRDFNSWLKQVATYVAIATEITSNNSTAERRLKNVNTVCALTEHIQKKSNCAVCEKDHHLYQCPTFRNFSVDDRWKLVKANHICFCCLRPGHVVAKCSYRRECGISACRKNHNRLLHDSNEKKSMEGNYSKKQTAVSTVGSITMTDEHLQTNEYVNTVVSAIGCKETTKKTLFKFLPVRLSGPLGSRVVTAFIDEGAKVSLIEERVARSIGVKGVSDLLSLRWISDKMTTEISQHVDIEISGVYNNAVKHQMKDVRTTKNLMLPAQTLRFREFQREYAELGKILVEDYVDAVPQILIGIPHTNLVRPISILNIGKGFAVHNTKLGWTLFGSNENSHSDIIVSCVVPENNDLNDLHRQVAEYFTLESLERQPEKEVISESDKRAEFILKATTKKVKNQYETGLLWKSDKIQFSDSYSMALKRLESVENKMFKNVEFAEWYKSKIEEYVKKNYARKLLQEEIAITESTWYLPHFAVCNVNKGNKMRLVFDAAAEINGMSLNSVLLKGPISYQPKSLLTVLFGFRRGRIGICADIREMFLRVNIRKEDQNAQRFLWRDGDRSRPPDTYVMKAMIFGSKSSPCSAQYIKNLNANQYKDVYPRAVKAIIDCHYVDDYVDSFDTVEEAIEVARTVKMIHSQAGFEIRDFVSNSNKFLQVMNNTSAETCHTDLTSVCRSDSTTEKILGMYWNSSTDTFCFELNFARIPRSVQDGLLRPTKSQVLSVAMSIFDPFGMLANITILSKLLLQRLWKVNVGWNELIPEDIYIKWYKWYKQLDNAKHLKIPRCYHTDITNLDSEIQLHIFVDASELAFSAAAYWRVSLNNEINVSFIMGKTRCSPLKALSIPRLELQAAVLGVRLKEAIIRSHDFKPSRVTLWSDSKTVIHWIRSDSRCYKQFVAHRIAEILDVSTVSNWKWVPGKNNPADEATRPQTISGVLQESKWIKGPSFLRTSEEYWPVLTEDVSAHEQSEERRQHFILLIENDLSIIPFEHFSSYYRLLKVGCWVLRAVDKFKRVFKNIDACNGTTSKILTVEEIKRSEIFLCRLVQRTVYSNEIRLLLSKQPVSKKSSIFKLSPVLDEDNVIRLGGRIDNANCLSYNAKRPIILPNHHIFSKILVQYYHEIYQHQNQEAIVCSIRSKFWIPSIRRLVRSAKSSCQLCKNMSAIPEPPQMGQLPCDRLIPYVRPFSYTGVDYIGPLQIAIGRRREKRWVAIFTCLSVRAIHLELAKDLSSDAAIMCLRNFINRRGVPIRLRSDCGTNFVGASKEEWVVISESLEKECTRRRIEWLFNTAGNPSAGGVWERLVRCVKRVLHFTLREKVPQLETLQSLLIEAENLVNSRPLTHLPLESNEAEPLTPNHFLLLMSQLHTNSNGG